MTKIKFLLSLHDRLSGLPKDDVEERLSFYSEMIEDRIEEGLSEEEAVAAVGTVEEIVFQILSDIPLVKITKEKIKSKRRLKAWEIVLLILGFPVWLPLLIAASAVAFSLYLSWWAIIVSIWAVFGSVLVSAFCGVIAGVGFVIWSNVPTGLAVISAGLVCGGLSILLFYGCREATKGTLRLTKTITLGIKKSFVKKEEES